MKSIDLNCDVGEMPEMLANGTQEQLMRLISSANIACGGHAGNPEMMRITLQQARRHQVCVGAHPGYEDLASFGREELHLSFDEVADLVYRQVAAIGKMAVQCGVSVGHVKTHGALYNQAAKDRRIACAIAAGVRRWSTEVVLIGLAGSLMLEEFAAQGFTVAAEAFADRRYESDGTLRSRKFEGALLHDPEEAADQALRIVSQDCVFTADGATVKVGADTICLHGDSPNAVAVAAAVRRKLTAVGIAIRPVTP
jgi:UPF0271 protein